MTVRRFMPYPVIGADSAVLGYNMQGTFEATAALDAAKAGGASIARVQFPWSEVEAYGSSTMALSAPKEAALAYCASIGLKPMLIAAFGPPYTPLTTLTLTADAAIGSTVLNVSGSLASIDTPYCHVLKSDGTQLPTDNGRWAYYGALIDSVDVGAGTITLAAPTAVALTTGNTLTVNRLKYKSLPDKDETRPEVAAYIAYAKFLAGRIAANGCTGWVELWNEPPWTHDNWNNRSRFYATPPGDLVADDRLSAILKAALLVNDLPAGVRFINGATHKTGTSGLVTNSLAPTSGQVAASVALEGIHPYGDKPEQSSWDPTQTDDRSGTNFYQVLNRLDASGNFRTLARRNDLANVGLRLTASECGGQLADDERQAIYLLRRVCSLWGMGVDALLYALHEGNDFDVAGAGPTYTPRQSYTALQRLMAQIALLGGSTGRRTLRVPQVIGCQDSQWPPIVVAVSGRDAALLLVWRRTYDLTGGAWASLDGSGTVDVKFTMPAGVSVAQAIDLKDGATVTPTIASGVMTVAAGESVTAIRLT